jgi:flavin reductase (DIM6/NTAB) family NADH-FMN oxidoreductase RutF
MSKIKMEATAGPMPILVSHPVVLVGANVDGKPDFAAVAWVGVAASNPPAISISLQPHRYSLKGIHQNMTFSVNIPSVDILAETDYCGLISGSKTDKVADTKFKVFYGALNSAPLIEQCPVNHACEVVQILSLGSHQLIVGRIKETFISEDCLKDGRPDITKIKPFFFSFHRQYTAVGEPVGEPFHSGSTISPAKAADGMAQFNKIRPPR